MKNAQNAHFSDSGSHLFFISFFFKLLAYENHIKLFIIKCQNRHINISPIHYSLIYLSWLMTHLCWSSQNFKWYIFKNEKVSISVSLSHPNLYHCWDFFFTFLVIGMIEMTSNLLKFKHWTSTWACIPCNEKHMLCVLCSVNSL